MTYKGRKIKQQIMREGHSVGVHVEMGDRQHLGAASQTDGC